MERFMKFALSSALFCISVGCSISAQVAPPPRPTPAPQTPPLPTEQPPATVQCPHLEMHPSLQIVRDGAPIKFMASISGGDQKNLILSWSISGGTITNGQGTPAIDVDTTGAGAEKNISASLLIGGFPPECAYEATSSVVVAGPAKKVDEYGTLKEEEETAKLDAFIATVTPAEQAWIIVYAGRNAVRGQAVAETRKIRAYLLKSGTSSNQIVTIDGGFREEATHELWLVPIGAESPKATPTISPKDIVYPKPTPPVKKP